MRVDKIGSCSGVMMQEALLGRIICNEPFRPKVPHDDSCIPISGAAISMGLPYLRQRCRGQHRACCRLEHLSVAYQTPPQECSNRVLSAVEHAEVCPPETCGDIRISRTDSTAPSLSMPWFDGGKMVTSAGLAITVEATTASTATGTAPAASAATTALTVVATRATAKQKRQPQLQQWQQAQMQALQKRQPQ